MKNVILASGSPRRKELLSILGIEFTIEPSSYEEDMTMDLDPGELVKHLSLGKAKDIAQKHKSGIVIGADTIISYMGKVLGKPHSPGKATEMLSLLSGKQHSVFTGYTIIDIESGQTITKAIETKVYFRELSQDEIREYVETGEPLDKAGAYGIQAKGVLLISGIEGDFNNVVGLPLTDVALDLKKLGIKIFNK